MYRVRGQLKRNALAEGLTLKVSDTLFFLILIMAVA